MSKTTLSLLSFVGFVVFSISAHYGIPQGIYIATSWKTVPGQVIDYKEWPTSVDAPGRAIDTYAFSVNGQSYHNQGLRPYRFNPLSWRLTETFLFGKTSTIWVNYSDTPEYMKANYPLGKTVTVYYDPSNPKNSVLEPLKSPGAFYRMYFPNGQFWYKGDSK